RRALLLGLHLVHRPAESLHRTHQFHPPLGRRCLPANLPERVRVHRHLDRLQARPRHLAGAAAQPAAVVLAADPRRRAAALGPPDGTRPGSRFWYVTLTMLKPLLAIVVLFSTIFTFSDFNIVYILTHGGPINSTHLFATYSRMIGLESGRIGEGAAISLYLFPLLMFVVWAQLRFVRKPVY